MNEFTLFYNKVSPTTWVHLSSLLMIAVFFKFGRLWSVRNLDLLALILISPGFVAVQFGHANNNAGVEQMGYIWLFAGAAWFLVRMLIDPMMVRRPLLEPNLSSGGLTFLGVALFVFLMANVLTGSPEPESKPLVASAVADPGTAKTDAAKTDAAKTDAAKTATAIGDEATADTTADNKAPESATSVNLAASSDGGGSSDPAANSDKPPLSAEANRAVREGPGYPPLFRMPNIVTQNMAALDVSPTSQKETIPKPTLDLLSARVILVLLHLLVVLGLVLIGYRHFDNIRTGIAAAVVYLMLPYTAEMTGFVRHVLPAAPLVWAILFYRRPMISGMLLGLAIGLSYYPLFLLPLWMSFYWPRGLARFLGGLVPTLGVMVGILALTAGSHAAFVQDLQQMFGWTIPQMLQENFEGFWHLRLLDPVYRIPILAAFVALSFTMAIWPAQKNLGTLMSCSAAIMLASQFWNAHFGGLFMAWYLPLLVLTIFRPNLEDRVALSVLGQTPWKVKRRPRLTRIERAA